MTAYAVREPTGSGLAGFGQWRYRTAVDAFPGAGRLQFDNADIDLATELYVNVTNDNSTDMSAFLALIEPGDLIYLQVSTDSTRFVICEVGTSSNAGGVYTFPLTQVEGQGGTPTNNTLVSFVTTVGGGVPGDHGALSGLTDDDHLQYLLIDGTRAMTGGLDFATPGDAVIYNETLDGDIHFDVNNTGSGANHRAFTIIAEDPVQGSSSIDLRPSDSCYLSNFIFMQTSLQIVNTESGIASAVSFRLDNAVPATTIRTFGIGTTDPGFGSWSITLGTGAFPNTMAFNGAFDARWNIATGQFFDFGGRIKSSDTYTYVSPFELFQMNPTINTINGASWNSWGMRSAISSNATAGGTGFGSQVGGLNFTHTLNGAAMAFNATGSQGTAVSALSYWTGGARTVSLIMGMNCQAGSFNSGTVTSVYAVNAQGITALGGAVATCSSLRGLVPINFLGGSFTTAAIGCWVSGAGAGPTRWGVYQDNATPNNAFAGSTSIGHLVAPVGAVNLDVASQLSIRAVGTFSILNFSNVAVAENRMWYGTATGLLNFDSVNQTNNHRLTLDLEASATSIEFGTATASAINFDFPSFSVGALQAVATDNWYMNLNTPAVHGPGSAGAYSSYLTSQNGNVDLASLAMSDVGTMLLHAAVFTDTAASVSGDYFTLAIAGAPTGGPAPSGERLALWVQSDKTLLDVLEVGGNVGFYGTAPIAQAAAPVTLADVITVLQNLGLTA